MKKYLQRIVIFFIPVLAFNLFLYIVISPLIAGDAYINKVKNVSSDIAAVVLADSHGLKLDNERLEKAGIANLSYSSDSYLDMYSKIAYLIENSSIETVLLTADRHTLSEYREISNNTDISKYLNNSTILPQSIITYLPVLQPRSRDLLRGYLKARFSNKLNSDGSPDMEALSWDNVGDREELAHERAEKQFGADIPSRVLRKAFEDIIALCNEHDIQLVGLKFPLSEIYLEEIGAQDFGAALLLQQNDKIVLDYEKIFIDRIELFEDADHINAEGADIFTNQLIEELHDQGIIDKND